MQSSTQVPSQTTTRKSRVRFNPTVKVSVLPSKKQILSLNTAAYATAVPENFVPVDDYETLIRGHEAHGSPQWVIDRIRNLHEASGYVRTGRSTGPEPYREGPPITSLEPLSAYYNRGERPPLEALIAYMEKHKYKQWAIERAIKNYHDKTQQLSLESLKESMSALFNNTSKSSTYKPKKKSIRQRFS